MVISDYNMPADSPYGDGLKLIDYLKRHFPAVRILVLTMISNPLILTRLQELGVDGVIQKSQLHGEIEKALNAVARNSTYRARHRQGSRWSPVTPPSINGCKTCHPRNSKYCACLLPDKVSVRSPAANIEAPRPLVRRKFPRCANLK